MPHPTEMNNMAKVFGDTIVGSSSQQGSFFSNASIVITCPYCMKKNTFPPNAMDNKTDKQLYCKYCGKQL